MGGSFFLYDRFKWTKYWNESVSTTTKSIQRGNAQAGHGEGIIKSRGHH